MLSDIFINVRFRSGDFNPNHLSFEFSIETSVISDNCSFTGNRTRRRKRCPMKGLKNISMAVVIWFYAGWFSGAMAQEVLTVGEVSARPGP